MRTLVFKKDLTLLYQSLFYDILGKMGVNVLSKGKKKKKATAKSSIRYELYGIVILILSVIALSGGGRVARALTYLFRFLIGTSDKVIPIIFIYIGLYVMMKRAWPTSWSRWKTGVVLGLIGWV